MAFSGFSKEADAFFKQLAVRQDRDWFKAHKADHERLWVAPMKELFAELRPGLERAFKPFKLAPEKHFRIYRDVRFAKDKSPFKTYQAAMIKIDDPAASSAPEQGAAALYLHLGTEDVVALGHWGFEPGELSKYRALLLDEKKGRALAARIAAVEKKGLAVSSFETLKRPPPGVAPEHPRAALLRHKGLGFELTKIPAGVRHSPRLARWILDQVRVAAPVVVEVEKARRTWR